MKEMAAEAVAAAKDKRLTIIPSEFEATWFRQATLHLAQANPPVCLIACVMLRNVFMLRKSGYNTERTDCEI